MKKAPFVIAISLALVVGGAAWWGLRGPSTAPPATNAGAGGTPPPAAPAAADPGDRLILKRPPKVEALAGRQRTAAEKAALVAKISADYQEIVGKAAEDFSAAGATFPGGFNAYLRQLALLEREKWRDYAEVLSTSELEDLQMREHHAGKMVQQWLGDSAATDEQRRQVLRLQREFDDKYSLVFDFAVPALLQRETERQALQEKILATLGAEQFPAWLRSEGEDYGKLSAYARQNGLRPDAALEAWRIRNEFLRRRLEINARGGPPGDVAAAQTLLAEQTRVKLGLVIGPSAVSSGAAIGLGWLPAK